MPGRMTELVGLLAGALTTASFVPQAVKVLRERQTAGISLGMYLLFSAGVTLWLVYGVAIGSLAIILANAVTLLLALIVLGMKIRLG